MAWRLTAPSQDRRRRVAVEHADDGRAGGQVAEQALDVAAMLRGRRRLGALRGGPAGVQAVGRGHRQQADVGQALGQPRVAASASGARAPQ